MDETKKTELADAQIKFWKEATAFLRTLGQKITPDEKAEKGKEDEDGLLGTVGDVLKRHGVEIDD